MIAEPCDAHQILSMRLPVLRGKIARRILVNFRVEPETIRPLLPPPFRPKLHRGFAIAGICLIRLEQIRPVSLPSILGVSSENAAHRIAVEWIENGMRREAVFIPRRDTGSFVNRIAGGRIFPGEHHAAQFAVTDTNGHLDFSMRSLDGKISADFTADETEALPPSSCFQSLAEASAYFEGGSLGYSATRDGRRLDGMTLRTLHWRVRALHVTELRSSFFSDSLCFPAGSVHFDHALIMRDIPHEWHMADDLYT